MRRVAEISRDAILANVAALDAVSSVVDVRADAYGHGLDIVLPLLAEAGVAAVLLSPDADPSALPSLMRAVDDAGGHRVIGPELFGLTDRTLQPALRLVAEVLAVKALKAGEGVSYGYSYRPDADTTLALIGIGYAHGAVRRAMNRARVHVGGAQHPIAGAISMDQFSVDLEGGSVRVGDDAVLFGDPSRGEPHVLDWVDATGISAAAITSRLASSVERVAA